MKDLYGLREKDIEKLKSCGLVRDQIICSDGRSRLDGAPLYAVFFDTSEEKEAAYNVVFGTEK